MNVAVRMLEQIDAVSILLPTLSKNGLKLESFQYISADNNVCNNANQPVSLPWRMHFDFVIRNAEGTFFTICKNQALCFITALKSQVYEINLNINNLCKNYYYLNILLLQKILLLSFLVCPFRNVFVGNVIIYHLFSQR